MRTLVEGRLIDSAAEAALANSGGERIRIKTPGRRQQHPVALRRQPAEGSVRPRLGSDAGIILMDDPMRGVDVGTKLEVYELIRAEAEPGAPSSGTRPRSKS
jgi:ribose transport system ATP-binding protein